MDLHVQVEKIHTRDDLVMFIHHLVQDLRICPEHWENATLETYLTAIAAWMQDMDGYYRHRGAEVPHQPTWKQMGEILLAARIYE
jgi:hypothetical protein